MSEKDHLLYRFIRNSLPEQIIIKKLINIQNSMGQKGGTQMNRPQYNFLCTETYVNYLL